ncbi:MAG: hypothetical protein ACJ76O_07505 [Gaiellaceae bacterium]
MTPDIQSVVSGLPDYNARNSSEVSYEQQQNGILDELAAGGSQCHHH